MSINIGDQGCAETIVSESKTAKAMKSGSLDVLATPALVALMEEAAVNALNLPDSQSSVGTSLSISHSAATPLGGKVTANAKLIEIDRRRLVFTVEAFDDAGQIGIGKHERFIVDVESFLSKVQKRNPRE